MGEKSTSFRRPFFDVISMSKKSTLFSTYFLDVISMCEISMSIRRFLVQRNINEQKVDVVSMYFFRSNFRLTEGQRVFSALPRCILMD